MHDFLPDDLRERLLANGRISQTRDHDPQPVVKFFTPDAGATWLLTELDPDDPDVAFGLCDTGMGMPRIGLREPGRIARPARQPGPTGRA